MSAKFLKDIYLKPHQNLLIVLLFILANTCFGQVNEFKFKQITTDDGLVDDMVIRVRQDDRGYMWFGTRSGLVRYDGIKLITYTFNPNQPNGLSGNNIDAFYPDKKGNLWIGTINGICRFDFEQDQPTAIPIKTKKQTWVSQINDLTSDAEGLLWIATQKDGLFSYNPSTKKFVHFFDDPLKQNSLKGSNVQTVLCTKENIIWVGTEKGLFKLNRKSSTFSHIGADKNSPIALSGSIVISLAEGDNGDIWIGTVYGGLNRLNLKNKTLKVYKHIPNDPNSLGDNIITTILYDNGKVWLGCGRGNKALQQLNVKTGKVTKYNIGEKKLGPRILGAVNDIFKDKTGIIWICQSYGGVSYFDPHWENYQHYELNPKNPRDVINAVYGTAPISNTRLWLSSFDGFILFDRNKGIIKEYNDNGKPLFLRNKSVLIGNQLWGPSDHGMYRLDLQTGKFSLLRQGSNGLSGSYVNTVILDKDGYVWAGSRLGGLDRIDPKTDYVKHFIHIEGDTSSLPENSVFVIYDIDEQHFWIGTNGGLALFDKKIESFKNYPYNPLDSTSISSNQVSDICISRSGVLWVATYGGGFNRFYPTTESFKRYTSQNKNIPNNTVYSCIEDDEGKIWISTATGIARFLPDKEKCDFLIQQPDYYKVSKLPDGELCFSGPRGMIIFNPKNISINTSPPEISIESVKINGQSYQVSLFTNSLNLEHNQNDIEFKFFAAHYSNPAQNKYAVFLKGYDDDDWRNLGTASFINYTNLEPGNYTLKVKAASSYDIWSKPIELEIYIKYPWWRTWWAYIFYFVGFFGILGGVRKLELNRRKEKENKRLLQFENERKTKELEEARQLQLSMLPKEIPSLPHLDIAVYMKTATEVGGDYYDFNVGLNGTLTVAIGDATGHGMQAGTIVTMVKTLFASNAPKSDIKTFFNESSNALKTIETGRLLMALMMIKINNHNLEVCNAGMPPLFIYRKQSNHVEEKILKGMPLGAIKNFPYEIIKTDLLSGDTILLLSDGLPELKNSNKKQYGYERVKELFGQTAEKQPEEIITHLKEEGSNWVNDKDPDDDVTFVVIKVK